MSKRAVVAGYAALIVLLSAGAAEGLSGHDTIFSNDIAEGEVHSSDIKNGTIRGKDVKNNSLTGKDIDESTLNFSTSPGQSLKGDKGDIGPAGPQGPAGTNGVSGREIVEEQESVPANQNSEATTQIRADCPNGKVSVGGGFYMFDRGVLILNSNPTIYGVSGWNVVANNPTGQPILVNSYAVCVTAN